MENAGIVTYTDSYLFKEEVNEAIMIDFADTITH